jgi:DNA-binding XRE family transcriptional regulator
MAKSRRDQYAEKLDEKQQKAVYMLLENEMLPTKEQRTQQELADELGITRKCLWQWRKQNQAFIEYKKEVAKDYLADEMGAFVRAVKQGISGDQPSSKFSDLYAKMMGLITDNKRVEIADSNEQRNDDNIREQIERLERLKGGGGDE